MVINTFIKQGMSHLNDCRHDAVLRKYGTRNTIAIFLAAYLLFYSTKKVGSELSNSVRKRVKVLLNGAIPERLLPEEANQAEVARKELEKTLNSHLFFKISVTGELLKVTNEKTIEFVSGLVEDLHEAIKENKLDLNLTDSQGLPDAEKGLFCNLFKGLSPQDIFVLENDYPDLYRNVVLLGKSMTDPPRKVNLFKRKTNFVFS